MEVRRPFTSEPYPFRIKRGKMKPQMIVIACFTNAANVLRISFVLLVIYEQSPKLIVFRI